MSMRSALPFLLAAVLGVSAAMLVACGSSASDRNKLIPPRSADRLKTALSDVRSAVDSGNCTSAERAIARARGVLVNLPSAVDARLVTRLRQGIDNLQKIAPTECTQHQTTSTQATTSTTTPTATTPTTATTDTTTTPTTPSTSTSTTTTTTPTSGTTTAPPATTTTAPADPSGGTTTP